MEKLQTVNGEELMSRPIVPIPFIVEGLLSQGLHILAGPPKIGKSWLALWLAVQVAKGEDVFDGKVKQGTALYLCLEDSTLRIQNRLLTIEENAPKEVEFCLSCKPIGRGLEMQLEDFISEHPDTVLIIIDTMQKVRVGDKDSSYAADYNDLSPLKKIADAHGLAILLIHHTRKQEDDDAVNRISGTTGISGTVDTTLVLLPENRGSRKAKLYCDGRDIEHREMSLYFNEDNIWEVKEDSRTDPDLLGDRIISLLSALLTERGEFIGTPTELKELIDPAGKYGISSRKINARISGSVAALEERGIHYLTRRSNGQRLIELRRDDSAVNPDPGIIVPIDPVPPDDESDL